MNKTPEKNGPTAWSRREMIAAAGGVAIGGALGALFMRASAGGAAGVRTLSGYGPLRAARDESTGLELLHLPEEFRYRTYGWTGDPLEGGAPTPPDHDGMAAFAAGSGRVRLVRNHEVSTEAGLFAPGDSYDPAAGGGTTTLEFDSASGRFLSARPSLLGTLRNCAGGPTPWGSWLSCEETILGPESGGRLKKTHGWIFEVPAAGFSSGRALEAMGRFVHEAIAVDPLTGIVYETEDQMTAGLYRFLPGSPGRLWEGGRLEMLAVEARPRFDTSTGQRRGVELPVAWVPIEDPTRAHSGRKPSDGHGVFHQGAAKGGATFARLEGACWGNAKLWFTSTNGGDSGRGQVWELDPQRSRLRLVLESPGAAVLDSPDNLCVSPRGGLLLCEDGREDQYLRGLTPDGRIFDFARNAVVLAGEKNRLKGDFHRTEFAGACFSPDGQWLFFNVQRPGITFAVTGPWERGAL